MQIFIWILKNNKKQPHNPKPQIKSEKEWNAKAAGIGE